MHYLSTYIWNHFNWFDFVLRLIIRHGARHVILGHGAWHVTHSDAVPGADAGPHRTNSCQCRLRLTSDSHWAGGWRNVSWQIQIKLSRPGPGPAPWVINGHNLTSFPLPVSCLKQQTLPSPDQAWNSRVHQWLMMNFPIAVKWIINLKTWRIIVSPEFFKPVWPIFPHLIVFVYPVTITVDFVKYYNAICNKGVMTLVHAGESKAFNL